MRRAGCAIVLSILTTSAVAGTNGLDPRFGAGGIVLLGATPVAGQHILFRPSAAIAVQADGKVLLAGGSPVAGSYEVPAVARLNADGSWDTSFGNHGVFSLSSNSLVPNGGTANQIGLLSDGSIVASGAAYFSTPFDYYKCVLMFKLTDAGALDTTFGGAAGGSFCHYFSSDTSGYTTNPFTSLQVGSDDLIYVTSSRAVTDANLGAIARYASNGAIDLAFGSGGIVTSPYYFANIRLQTDQRLLAEAAGGPFFYRFTAAGDADPTFGSNGFFSFDLQQFSFVWTEQMRLDDAGNILAVFIPRSTTGPNIQIVIRVTSSGSADTTFNANTPQPGFPGLASIAVAGTKNSGGGGSADIQALPDGHLMLASTDIYKTQLRRLANDAAFDPGFGDVATPGIADLSFASDINHLYASATDNAGRLLLAVDFSTETASCRALLRIIPDQISGNGFEATPILPACPP